MSKKCSSTALCPLGRSEVLTEPNGEDIERLSHCITGYTHFCVDNVVSDRTVACFPNNKQWINMDIKDILNEKKKKAFRAGDREQLKHIHREQDQGGQHGKRKIEARLQQSNIIKGGEA